VFEVDAQPRVDVQVADGVTGEPRRLTTYSGIAWYGGRVDVVASVNVFRYDSMDGQVFLPDSLPYDPEHAARAQVTTNVGVQVSGRDAFRVVGHGSLVPDLEGRRIAWLQLHLAGRTSVPVGISYRIDVIGPLEIVLPPGP
jgi:hypothetical protein